MNKTLLKTSVAVISLAVIMLSTTALISYAKPNDNGFNIPVMLGLGNGNSWVGVGIQKMFKHQYMLPPGKGLGLGIKCCTFELSSEFKDKVLSILRSDENVSRLLDEGYNISAIRPIIKLVVLGDGSVTLKVTEVWVCLYKKGEGVVHVLINYSDGKVIKVYGCECIAK